MLAKEKLGFALEGRLLTRVSEYLSSLSDTQVEELNRAGNLVLAIRLEVVHEFSAFLGELGAPDSFIYLNRRYESVLKRIEKEIKL